MEEFIEDVGVLKEHVFVEDGRNVTLVYLSLHANEGTRIEFLWGDLGLVCVLNRECGGSHVSGGQQGGWFGLWVDMFLDSSCKLRRIPLTVCVATWYKCRVKKVCIKL